MNFLLAEAPALIPPDLEALHGLVPTIVCKEDQPRPPVVRRERMSRCTLRAAHGQTIARVVI
jgi:hypothetical protein